MKPLSRRALRRPTWPVAVNRFVSYVTLPWVRLVSRTPAARRAKCATIRHFDERFTRLWERVERQVRVRGPARRARTSTGSTSRRRTSATSIAALERGGEVAGYVVYRHVQEPRGRVTLLVDFLADPDDDARRSLTLLRWVDREARAADSDKIRTFAMHEGFRKLLQQVRATTP